MSDRGAPWLQVDGLAFSRSGRPILQQVGLAVSPGETLLLTGHNGSGRINLSTKPL